MEERTVEKYSTISNVLKKRNAMLESITEYRIATIEDIREKTTNFKVLIVTKKKRGKYVDTLPFLNGNVSYNKATDLIIKVFTNLISEEEIREGKSLDRNILEEIEDELETYFGSCRYAMLIHDSIENYLNKVKPVMAFTNREMDELLEKMEKELMLNAQIAKEAKKAIEILVTKLLNDCKGVRKAICAKLSLNELVINGRSISPNALEKIDNTMANIIYMLQEGKGPNIKYSLLSEDLELMCTIFDEYGGYLENIICTLDDIWNLTDFI